MPRTVLCLEDVAIKKKIGLAKQKMKNNNNKKPNNN